MRLEDIITVFLAACVFLFMIRSDKELKEEFSNKWHYYLFVFLLLSMIVATLLFVCIYGNYKSAEVRAIYRIELKDGRVVTGQNCRRQSGINICQIPESELCREESSAMFDVSVESFSRQQ